MKKTLCVLVLLISISILLPIIVFLVKQSSYVFPEPLPFRFVSWVGICLITLVFLISLVLVIILIRKKGIYNIIFSLVFAVCLVVSFYFGTISYVIFSDSCWQSLTQNVDDFGLVDSNFDENIIICDLNFSKIMSLKTTMIYEYYYNYHSKLGADEFYIYFDVELEKEDYYYLKRVFQESQNFKESKSIQFDGATTKFDTITNKFVLSEYESTGVDKWNEMYVIFWDETCRFSIKSAGVCYT